MKVREVITYKSYFEDFFKEQSPKVRDKIIKILDIIEQIDRIPSTYLKYIEALMAYLKSGFKWRVIFFVYSASLTVVS